MRNLIATVILLVLFFSYYSRQVTNPIIKKKANFYKCMFLFLWTNGQRPVRDTRTSPKMRKDGRILHMAPLGCFSVDTQLILVPQADSSLTTQNARISSPLAVYTMSDSTLFAHVYYVVFIV